MPYLWAKGATMKTAGELLCNYWHESENPRTVYAAFDSKNGLVWWSVNKRDIAKFIDRSYNSLWMATIKPILQVSSQTE